MSKDKKADIIAANSTASMPEQKDERPVFVKKIGKTTYWVQIHFNNTSLETMSDKSSGCSAMRSTECNVLFSAKIP